MGIKGSSNRFRVVDHASVERNRVIRHPSRPRDFLYFPGTRNRTLHSRPHHHLSINWNLRLHSHAQVLLMAQDDHHWWIFTGLPRCYDRHAVLPLLTERRSNSYSYHPYTHSGLYHAHELHCYHGIYVHLWLDPRLQCLAIHQLHDASPPGNDRLCRKLDPCWPLDRFLLLRDGNDEKPLRDDVHLLRGDLHPIDSLRLHLDQHQGPEREKSADAVAMMIYLILHLIPSTIIDYRTWIFG